MSTIEEVLIHFQGIDNVSPTVQQIDQTLGGAMGTATSQGGGLVNTMRELGGIFQGLNGLVMGVFGTYGLSTFKNMTYGMATAREEVKGLYESVAGSTADASSEASQLWNYMDELTNQGYVQLDDLTQAMNVFGMSTGSGVEGMKIAVDMVNDIGNRAIQMGYDSNRQQLLMQGVAQGLNGNMRMLNVAFGITKDKLKALGWSGASTDIQGYIDALDEYLNKNVKMDNLLDSTQGRVVALQKRFRIAGRNLGNYMLPPINAIMNGFTQLNAQSNDLLASLIIIGTGAMSGFASILPTLSPLIQLYEFIGKRSLNFNVSGLSSLVQTRTVTGRLLANTKDLIASPIAGWIRYWTRSNLLPYIDRVRLSIRRLYLTNVVYGDSFTRLNGIFNNVNGRFLSGFGRISRAVGNAQIKLAQFVATYGSLEGRANVIGRLASQSDRLEQLGSSMMSKWVSPLRMEQLRSQGFKLPTPSLEMARSQGFNAHDNTVMNRLAQETQALKMNRREQELNRLERQKGILTTIRNALGLGTDTARTVANTTAKEFNVGMTLAQRTAMADANKQQAITNLLKLEEMGIINKESLYMALYNLGILSEAETRELVTVATFEEQNAKRGLFGTNIALTGSIWAMLAPILLIVGAIVLIILVVDQIGKTLGWWDNWKEMLDAIVNGLNRIWQAFINNPNVQGFIKDIQGLFGALGGAIQWVAWQVLQFFGWKDDGGEVDIVRGIIDVFGALGDILGKIVNAVKWFFTVTAPIWQAIFTVISIPVRAIIGLLRGIICIILGCSPGIVPAMQTLAGVFRSIWNGLASFLTNPIGTILRLLNGLTGNFFSIARNMGLSLWNGLNSILGGLPQRVWQTFWNMLNNLKRIPQMIWGTAQDIGQQAYNGLDSAVSGLTGGLVHLPGANQNNAKTNARTMGNATKNYNNSRNMNRGHIINIGQGAIQLDARNLTTKESKQIMINALEGLTTYETVHTKKAKGSK